MTTDYACLRCGQRFAIDVTDAEMGASLDAGRDDACPGCAQRVGTGVVRCRRCDGEISLAFPHWHVQCDLAAGDCPRCGARYVSPCVC